MMHKPDLLILDEPSSGLDPLMQQTFYQLLRETRDDGRTVFLSSHVLSEVQTVCDRVGILRDGRLRAVESVEALTHVEFRRIEILTREEIDAEILRRVPGASEVRVDGRRAKLQLRGDFDPLLRALADSYVEDLRLQEPTLEKRSSWPITAMRRRRAADGRYFAGQPHRQRAPGDFLVAGAFPFSVSMPWPWCRTRAACNNTGNCSNPSARSPI